MKVDNIYLVGLQQLCRININKFLLPGCPPPDLEIVYDFKENNMPLDMGAFAVNSELYFFGGKKHEDGYNQHVFKAKHNGNTLSLVRARIPPTHGPKPDVYVATLGGKWYALSSFPVFHDIPKVPSPVFEVYDPITDSWDCLPDPPFADNFYAQHVVTFHGFGRHIFLANVMGHWVFDVDDRKWGNFKSFGNPFASLSRYPFVLKGATAAYRNLMIAFTKRGMVAYSIGADGYCRDVIELKELNPPTSLEDSTIGFVRCLDDDGRMCFVCRMIAETAEIGIYISIFQVKLDDGGESSPVSADVLCYHFYDTNMLADPFFPRHSLIVWDDDLMLMLSHAKSLSVFGSWECP